MAEKDTNSDTLLRIRQLERSVTALTKERDDLAKDVEQLCLSRGGHMFSSSYVASERLRFLEAELKDQRQALAKMTADKDNLQEDMWQIKAAKKQSDEGWQQERQHAAALQKDLDFFKASSARALTERDRAAFDAHTTQAELEAKCAALQDTKAQLVLAQQVSRDLQAQLSSSQQQLEAEQQEAASCRVQLRQQKQRSEQQLQQQRHVHEQQLQQLQQDLEQQLGQKEEATRKVQAELSSTQQVKAALACEQSALKTSVNTLQQQLEEANAAVQSTQAQLVATKKSNVELHRQLNTSSAAVQDLQTLLEQTSAALVASQARLMETHTGAASRADSNSPGRSAELQQEITHLKALLAEADDQLQQAAKDKLQVQLELSQAQACEDESSHTLMQLQALFHHCKELLATATQQKVEALLQVANKEALDLAEQTGQTHQQQQQLYPLQGLSTRSCTGGGGGGGGSTPPCTTPPASPSTQEPRAAAAPGSSSSSSSMSASFTNKSCLDAAGVEPTAAAAAVSMADTDSSSASACRPRLEVLPLSASPCEEGGRHSSTPPGHQPTAVVAHGLQQLFLLTHSYLTLLQQLPPADIAAAAEGGGGGGKKSTPGSTQDLLTRLAATSQALDRDKQQLLASCGLKQQQLEDLSLALLQHCAAAAAAGESSSPASTSPVQQQGAASGRVGLGKLLRHHGNTSPVAAAAAASAGAGAGAPLSGSGPAVPTAALVASLSAAFSNPAGTAAYAGADGGGNGGCVPVGCVSDIVGLQLVLCHELQQLAECGLSALRYIPKLAAISTLMQGNW